MYRYLARVGKSWISSPSDDHVFRPEDQNILFIGNSYTGFHQLPSLTQEALEKGMSPDEERIIHVKSHTPPNESFAGHWKGLEKGDRFSRLSFDFYYRSHHLQRWLLSNQQGQGSHEGTDVNNRYWKWVTLQNHSVQAGFYKSEDPNKKMLFEKSLEAAKNINNVIAEQYPDSKTLFILTWGRPGRDKGNPELYPDFLTMQQLLLEGYQTYASETSTPSRPTFVAPVGLVFRTIYNDLVAAGNDDPTRPGSLFYDLYDKGDHHPSLAGSYVYALTVYATITGRDVVVDLKDWCPGGLDEVVARTLRDAVRRTIHQTVQNKSIRYSWQQ